MTRLLASILPFAALAAAQTLDTGILGIVTDPGGAVITSADVTITQPATGHTRTVTTGADGSYEVRYLTPGSTPLKFAHKGSGRSVAPESSYRFHNLRDSIFPFK